MCPERIYKYLPAKYLQRTIEEGRLLFRNLTYFKQTEDVNRADHLEAIHRHNPTNNVTIQNSTKGITINVNASFLNSIDSDLVFAFCTSKVLDDTLF